MEKGIDLGIKVIRNPLGQKVLRSGGLLGTIRGTSCVPRRKVKIGYDALNIRGVA